MDRRLFIVIAVLGFHGLGLWALQTGLLRRAVELVEPVMVPVVVLTEMVKPPPLATPAAPPTRMASAALQPRPQPLPQPKPASTQRTVAPLQPVAHPTPQALAVPGPAPAPLAPTGSVTPHPSAAPATLTERAPAPPAPAAPAPARVEQPSSSAEHLHNAPPPYPPLSKRLGEQGKVVVRAFIETNGTASQAELHSASGYERLDQAALQTVLKWRYVPGKRAGVPEAMWFNVPITFVLE